MNVFFGAEYAEYKEARERWLAKCEAYKISHNLPVEYEITSSDVAEIIAGLDSVADSQDDTLARLRESLSNSLRLLDEVADSRALKPGGGL